MLRYCSKVCKYISGNLKHMKRSLMEETQELRERDYQFFTSDDTKEIPTEPLKERDYHFVTTDEIKEFPKESL